MISMLRGQFNLFLLLAIIVNKLSYHEARNYDAYIAKLLDDSQLAKQHFINRNPRGQLILDRLSSPEFRSRYFLVTDPLNDNAELEEERWREFLTDLAKAKEEATTEYDAQEPVLKEDILEPDVFDSKDIAPRRLEVAYQNQLWGVQKVEGGSSYMDQWPGHPLLGDITSDIQHWPSALKNDSLPSYCNPPNPCPIGYDPDQLPAPCDPNVDPSVEANRAWILNKMATGECSCDREHMHTCSIGDERSEPSMKSFKRNPYLHGQERKRLEAKKAFSTQMTNPAVQGEILKTVVKKNGRYPSISE